MWNSTGAYSIVLGFWEVISTNLSQASFEFQQLKQWNRIEIEKFAIHARKMLDIQKATLTLMLGQKSWLIKVTGLITHYFLLS